MAKTAKKAKKKAKTAKKTKKKAKTAKKAKKKAKTFTATGKTLDEAVDEKANAQFFGKGAIDVLNERYARGEMSTDEYKERRKALEKHLR